MRKIIVIVLVMFCFFLSTCDQRKEKKVTYFDDEKKIESEIEYEDGVKHGNEITYYKNGNVRSKASYYKGKLNGTFEEFYPNGTSLNTKIFNNGIRVGETKAFNEDGSLLEIQYYDSTGKLLDFKRFLKDGKRDRKKLAPLFWINKDTLQIGEQLDFEARIGNITDSRMLSGKLFIGKLFNVTKDGNPDYLLDTTNVIESDRNLYQYKIIAASKGPSSICGYLVTEIPVQLGDSIVRFVFEYPYFVK